MDFLKWWPLLPIAFLCTLQTVASCNQTVCCTFTPNSTRNGLLDDTTTLEVTMSCTCARQMRLYATSAQVDLPRIAHVSLVDNRVFNCQPERETRGMSMRVRGQFLGFARAKIVLNQVERQQPEVELEYDLAVVRKSRSLDVIFVLSVATMVSLNMVNMGMAIDLQVVAETIRKPFAPAIGLVCQFLFMPLSAYAVSLLVLSTSYYRLGLFTLGCSPGGGASNFWTFLFDGDLDLSVTMTFVSTVSALAFMPLWLFTLGATLFDAADIHIPYSNLLSYLCALLIPILVGVLIRRKYGSFADNCKSYMRFMTIAMLLFIFTFGVYANLYMIELLWTQWRIIVAGTAVSWAGYVFGALFALVFRQPMHKVIAIAIETGVQNTGISIVLLRLSLPQPEADLSSVLPVAGSIMVFIPLFLCWCKKMVRERGEKRGQVKVCGELPSPPSDDVDGTKAKRASFESPNVEAGFLRQSEKRTKCPVLSVASTKQLES